jgi:hypothetical protein
LQWKGRGGGIVTPLGKENSKCNTWNKNKSAAIIFIRVNISKSWTKIYFLKKKT